MQILESRITQTLQNDGRMRQQRFCNQQEVGSNFQDVHVILTALKACSRTRNLKAGKQVHAECGHHCNIYVANALINMYAKCGSMVDARDVFDHMKSVTVVSWTTLILGYAENGQGRTALDIFTRMRTEGLAPDSVSLVAALKACTSLATKEGGSRWAECRDAAEEIHNCAVENGYSSDVYVQNSLVDVLSKCGNMVDAREVFSGMKHPTVVSWTALIMGYAGNGQGYTALGIFAKMGAEGISPNSVTFVAALKACTSLVVNEGTSVWAECRERGKEIHNLAMGNRSSHVYVESTLVDMYAKCGSMLDAAEVFFSMKHQTVVSWNVLILGYAENGQGHTALDCFTKMRIEGAAPDSITLVAALKACTSLAEASRCTECMERGIEIHSVVVENGCISDVYVQSTLVDMYAKCGSMVDACKVFDGMRHPGIASWTALILGYAENGYGELAMDMFFRMNNEGPVPDAVTLVAALKACTSLEVKCSEKGKGIHNIAMENVCHSDIYLENSLIDMYGKCGSMDYAREVFDNMKHSTVVSWSALISGYADNGQGHTALDMYTTMRNEGPPPNSVTFEAALKACGLVGALEFGREIHKELKNGNDHDVVLVNCLVDFYAKCGSLVEAQNVFNLHAEIRNMITWNALMAGFSSSGDTEAVFQLFKEMQEAGFKPDGITFLCILTCCSRAGLIVKGKECFDAMSTKFSIIPTVKHYNCMIDLFGRASKLDDAMALLEGMPSGPNDISWRTVLGACRKWKNVEIGKLAAQSLAVLDESDCTESP